MKTPAASLVIFALLAAAACDGPMDLLVVGDEPTSVDATPIEIHPDRCALFDLESDPETIQKIDLSGDLLTITVEYSGGCDDHVFSLHAGACVLESWPPQSDIYLVHDDPGDPCDAIVTEELVFDLVPLKKTYREDLQGRSRTLVLNIYVPGSPTSYLPKPLYDMGSE